MEVKPYYYSTIFGQICDMDSIQIYKMYSLSVKDNRLLGLNRPGSSVKKHFGQDDAVLISFKTFENGSL